MFNYLVGAVALACNILSALALHAQRRATQQPPPPQGSTQRPVSNAMLAYSVPLLWFVGEYLWCEHVHVYTYDIFRERTGAKMCWGCWCFYPFFYVVGAWCLVEKPLEDISAPAALGACAAADCGLLLPAATFTSKLHSSWCWRVHASQPDFLIRTPPTPPSRLALATSLARPPPSPSKGCVALFACGWLLTRGANLQKHAWRTREGSGHDDSDGGNSKAFWEPFGPMGPRITQRTVAGSRGRLLCSGFWGLARHVNYLGEVTQGVALALPGWLATGSVVPWAYPAYYAALFVGRQLDDDRACAAKYGAAWTAYCKQVPYHIVPFVY